MAWTIYRNTDASAPVLTGATGSLITLFDAVLVNGYGSQPAAGWNKVLSSTNRAVYQHFNGKYYRVDDGNVAGSSILRAYETMSNVDTGSGAIMSGSGGISNDFRINKMRTTSSAAPINWTIAADNKTCVVLVATGSDNTWRGTYFGEFYSYKPGDPYNGCLYGDRVTNYFGFSSAYTLISSFILFRNYNNVPGSISASVVAHPLTSGGSGFLFVDNGINPADGKWWVTEMPILTGTTEYCVRGMLRGCWQGLFSAASGISNNYQFSGSEESSGRIFEYFKMLNGTTFCLELTEPPSSSI